ncbi:MAG: hypothetical protein QG608_3719, partial [Actinomycetota bacterium]|nr:hypothetical protein [Actinomycetota bacterium]
MRTRLRTTATVAVATVGVAVVGLAMQAMVAPAHAAQTISNVAYAPAQPAGGKGHLLDLYLPEGSGLRPLVIWTTGSAWMSDTGKDGARSIASTFNAKGYAVAGVSVRSSSQAKYPAQVHDIKAAIRWLRSHAGEYRLDPNRFAVMGDSSGGWVADMAALTGGVADLEGTLGTTGVSSAVQAGVAFFGPTDFLKMNAQKLPNGMDHDGASSPESQLIGCALQSCPDKVAKANPVKYVDKSDPPMMLLHGQADTLVPHGQSVLLYEALKAACTEAQFFSVPGADHGTSNVLSSSHYGSQTVRTTTTCTEKTSIGSPNPSWDTVEQFLRKALNVGGTDPTPTQTTPTPTPTPSTTPTPTPTTPTPSTTPSEQQGCSAAY